MRCVYLIGLLLIAAPVYGQANEAEKLFKKMEEKIRSAKSLHIEFEAETTVKMGKVIVIGSFDVAEGRKKYCFKSELKTPEGKSLDKLIVSDGKSTYTKVHMANVKETRSPKAQEVQDNHLRIVARGGLPLLLHEARYTGLDAIEGDINDMEKGIPLKNFELGAKEKIGDHETQIVMFQRGAFEDGKPENKATVQMWIDTKSHLPVKQTVAYTREKGQGTVHSVLTFRTIAVDGVIEPKVFELPK